jgi:AcrR family transcriptional regulator
MIPRRDPEHTRERLLRAAIDFVSSNGAANLTLDAVATCAGVSKGGLLHHFPSKQALVHALMERIAKTFANRLQYHLDAEAGATPGRWTRAYINASFEYEPDELKLTSAIATVVSSDPALVHVLQSQFAWIDERIENDGLPAARATAIRLACDGLWISELLELSTVQNPLRSSVRQALMEMTR